MSGSSQRTGLSATSTKTGRSRTSIRPDALGALQLGERYVPFMLEYERQALYPKEARERLERYRNYFETGLPVEDHGTTPSVLFVFPTEEHEDRFVAGVGGERTVPILTSNLHVLGGAGRAIGELASPVGPLRQRTHSALEPDTPMRSAFVAARLKCSCPFRSQKQDEMLP